MAVEIPKEPIEIALEKAEAMVETMIQEGAVYAYVNGKTGKYSVGKTITEFPATVRFSCYCLQPDPSRTVPIQGKKEFIWALADCIMAGTTLTDVTENVRKTL